MPADSVLLEHRPTVHPESSGRGTAAGVEVLLQRNGERPDEDERTRDRGSSLLNQFSASSAVADHRLWLISAPVLVETIVGAQWDLCGHRSETLAHLGYPPYLLTIIGVAKVLAVAALLAPGLLRLKEWAYAGIVFVYLGAACSHFAVDDPVDKVVVPTIFAVMALLSWATRPPARRDPAPLELSRLRAKVSWL